MEKIAFLMKPIPSGVFLKVYVFFNWFAVNLYAISWPTGYLILYPTKRNTSYYPPHFIQSDRSCSFSESTSQRSSSSKSRDPRANRFTTNLGDSGNSSPSGRASGHNRRFSGPTMRSHMRNPWRVTTRDMDDPTARACRILRQSP